MESVALTALCPLLSLGACPRCPPESKSHCLSLPYPVVCVDAPGSSCSPSHPGHHVVLAGMPTEVSWHIGEQL